MAKRKQEIKVVLHTPSKMDMERQRQAEEFWIEKMVAFIEKFNPNEPERKYLTIHFASLDFKGAFSQRSAEKERKSFG